MYKHSATEFVKWWVIMLIKTQIANNKEVKQTIKSDKILKHKKKEKKKREIVCIHNTAARIRSSKK